MADPVRNFAVSTVATAPSPASSGTTLEVDDPTLFPDPDAEGAFNVIVFPNGDRPTPANAEIVRVTAEAANVWTIDRQEEGTSARSIIVGDQVLLGPTAKTVVDLDSAPGVISGSAYYYVPAMPASLMQGQTPTLNSLDVWPIWLPAGVTVDRLGLVVEVGEASSVARLGIYLDADGLPGALLVDAGTVSCATSGNKEVTLSQVIPASGHYWLAHVQQVASSSVMITGASNATAPTLPQPTWLTGVPVHGTGFAGYNKTGVSGALPDPFGSPTPTGTVFGVWARVA